MKKLIYGLIVLLAILHQDFWWWDRSDPLVFGFIPIGLAWHAGVSITAAILWAAAVKYCWPIQEEEDESDEIDTNHSTSGGGDYR